MYNGTFEYLADKDRLIETGKESAVLKETQVNGL